jgi:hypothetical protein
LFGSLHDELFEAMEPFVTVFNSDCFRGISRARIFAGSDGDASVIAEGQIEFVFNRKTGKIVYWKQ